MDNIISERVAIRSILLILLLLVVFHIMVLVGLIPFDIVWGGKFTDAKQMQGFELASVLITLLMLLVVAARGGVIRATGRAKLISICLWIMFVFFCFNTLGNLLSENSFEKLVFAPITFLLALLLFRVLRTKRPDVG
jgi:hypothetical protein